LVDQAVRFTVYQSFVNLDSALSEYITWYPNVTPPYVDAFSPGNGATGVPIGTTSFSFHFKQTGNNASGANNASLTVNCPGFGGLKNCSTGLNCTGTSADYTVIYGGITLGYDNVVSCIINGQDLASPPIVMGQQMYYFTVQPDPNPALTVTTTILPSGTVGTSYSTTLAATGGTSPYTWGKSAGTLPPGLVVPVAGTGAWGVPSTAGTYSFTIRATDAAAATDTQVVSITIVPTIPGGGTQQSLNFDDTFINAGSPGTNYVTSTELRTYTWPTTTVANRVLIFDNADIQAMPSGKTVLSAKLRLYLTGYDGYGGTNPMRVHVYSSTPFDTTTATWTNFSSTLTKLSMTDVSLVSGWYEFDVTAAVVAAYATSPRSPIYIALDGSQDGAQDTNRIFASVNHATAEWRPQLVVVYSIPAVCVPPNAPGGHYVQAGNAQITMYPGTAAGVLFYSVYYTSDGTTPSKTNGTLLAGVTSGQVLSGLINDTLYKFVFTASYAGCESEVSSVDTATPTAPPVTPVVPAAPTSPAVVSMSGAVTIYPGSSPGATSYNAYYTDNGAIPSKTVYTTKITGATGGRAITGLTNGTTYKFTFTAVNDTGESDISGIISVIPQAAVGINFLVGGKNQIGNVISGQLKNYISE
jgi:hypothetical protein